MRLPWIDGLGLASTLGQLPPRETRIPSRTTTDDSAYLLQCTQDLANEEPADARYWTAYDRFMIERQARAMRTAYINGLIVRAWRRLRERVAGLALRASGPQR